MSEEFVPDERFIRSCIFYDVKRKKSFIDSYEDFRAAFGENLISRDDFHFWYSRFSEGHRDLDFERNPENPPTPMTDKQKFALGIVSKYSGLRDQLRLPKITKEMYSHDRIYSDRKNYEMLDFMISADFIAVKYTKDIQVIYKLPYSEAKGKYVIVDVDPIGRLYMDLRYVIWSKVNRFERIHFYYDRRAVDEKRNETIQMGDELFLRFGDIISQFDNKMHVKSVSIQTEHLPYFEQILFSLKPGILEDIKLFNVDFPIGRDIGTIRYNEQQIETETKREEWGDYEYADLETLQRIVEMKQFKEAKKIRWHHRTIQVPITHFFNFESFEVSGVPELKTSDLETLKKLAISNDSKKPFKSGLIYRPSKLSIDDASKVLGLCQPPMEQCTDTWHLKVPQSMDRMVFYLGEVSVFTRRLTPGKTSEKKKRKKKRKRVE